MELSKGEKIIIGMLADIHKAVVKDGEGETDLNLLMRSIYDGQLWSLDWELTGLLHDYEAPEHVVKETGNYMDMWYFLETSYAALDTADKTKVDAANQGSAPRFGGFDGNQEDHYGVAKHFVDVMGRFTHFRGRDLNSHSARVARYEAMYAVFDPLRATLADRQMTADEIISILDAR